MICLTRIVAIMKKIHLSLAVLWLLSCLNLRAQDTLVIVNDSTATLPLNWPNSINAAYEDWSVIANPFALEHITASDFNQGVISDPSLLVQGRVAGTQIYNRGGDPNVEALFRVRGLSSLSQRQPLFVIDGVPGVALESVDPNDIASITILKDGASQALYGIRASNGVVLINTKRSNASPGRLAITYNGQVASSEAHNSIPVLDAAEFVNRNGLDFGNSTDWMEEVQRSALSHTHGLAVAGRTAKTDYRISGNYRDQEGVLKKSGFEQLNFRARLGTSLLRDKLRVNLTTSYTDRTSDFSFQEGFRYAVSQNPTAPIFAADAPFTASTTRFGGYYEMVGLFDGFNPLALVELNDRTGQNQVFNGQALLQYELLPQLQLNFRYAYQSQLATQRAYYSPQSYFRGNAASPHDSIRGRAELIDFDEALSVSEFFINYGTELGNTKLDLTVGTSYSDANAQEDDFTLFGFTDPSLLETRRIDDYDDWLGVTGSSIDTLSSSWTTRHAAFFGRLQFNFADQLFLHAALRTEGSSRLGTDNQWGAFPAVGAAWDLGKKMSAFDMFKLRISYGVTGAVPDDPGLSAEKITTFILPTSPPAVSIDREANPDLKWEEKSEVNLGVDVRSGRFQAYFEWYNREVSDWIELESAQFTVRTGNTDALKSTGIELGMDAMLVQKKDISYQMGLRVATFRSEFTELGQDFRSISSACCNSGNPVIVGKVGQQVGEFLAPVSLGVDEDGNIIYEDTNGDGFIDQDPSLAYEEGSDLAVVGSGLPTMELGWTHRFRYRNWELSAFLRGAFGHSLFNVNRRFYEPEFYNRSPYNFVNTELRVEGLQSGLYSDVNIEEADFLKLDFLTLARTFAIGGQPDSPRLRVSLTAQNILLSSNYTGADPEPVFEDYGSTDNGGSLRFRFRDPLSPGIDRRTNYLPARTFTLGMNLTL